MKYLFLLSDTLSNSHPLQCHAEMRPLMVSPPLLVPGHIHSSLSHRLQILSAHLVAALSWKRYTYFLLVVSPHLAHHLASLRIQQTILGIFKIAQPTCLTSLTTFPARSRVFCVRVPSPLALPSLAPNSLLLGSWSGTEDSAAFHRPRSPPTQRSQDNPSVCTPFYFPTPSLLSISQASTGLRFEFHSGPGGGSSRTFVLGGSNTLRRSPPPADRPVPTMLEYVLFQHQHCHF